ncbi:MAG: YbhB/YbcL family Raf kinase inhibitor-like protein [Deltaproteobacteria bacterium]|nr:YbhB/YbcL family Raf kinase inhibitor-like protein [Kofleriaceae bacterium]
MQLTSLAFSDGGEIPRRHTQDGADLSPPLRWRDVPPGTESLALIVDDPDAPDPAAPKRTFVHWVVTNVPPNVSALDEGTKTTGGIVGKNDYDHADWDGPKPPIGRHRYVFKLYALDTRLELPEVTKTAVERAMEGHVLAQATLVGTYARSARA